MLGEALNELQGMTPEQFRAPEIDAPKSAHFVGVATDYQRALTTLIDDANRMHTKLHRAIGLPGGAHANLPIEHRRLHVTINVGEKLLFEDLTQTFSKLGAKTVFIDRNWHVYWLELTPIDRLKGAWYELTHPYR